MSTKDAPLTSGKIYKPLMKFMLPVMLAAFLQAMYSAVDLMVIGRFVTEDVQLATAAAVRRILFRQAPARHRQMSGRPVWSRSFVSVRAGGARGKSRGSGSKSGKRPVEAGREPASSGN